MGNARSADSRAAIILGLFAVIAERGMDAVTFRSVAAAAGVSVGRVQHHFGTRDALVRAGCAAMLAGAQARHDERVGAADAARQLRHAVAHVIPETPADRRGRLVWFAYVAKSVDDPQLARLLAEAKRGQEKEAARLLDVLGDPRPVPRARELIALADGLAVRVLIGDLTSEDALALLPP